TIQASAEGYRAAEHAIVVEDGGVRVELALAPETTAPSGPALTGVTTDGVTDAAVAGALVALDNGRSTRTGVDGAFRVPVPALGTLQQVQVTSSGTIDRITYLSVQAEPVTLTLIPRSLGADAFDQMFRGNGGELHRWMAAPVLIIQR